jgi:hypothetical protein
MRKNSLAQAVGMALLLIATGLAAAFAWLTDKNRQSIPLEAASISFSSQVEQNGDTFYISIKNESDREIFMRIGLIHESSSSHWANALGSAPELDPGWGDDSLMPLFLSSSFELSSAGGAGNADWLLESAKCAKAVFSLGGYGSKKAFINLVDAEESNFALIPPDISFTIEARMAGIPSSVSLSFVAEAIQGTQECLEYMGDPLRSGLAAPWVLG